MHEQEEATLQDVVTWNKWKNLTPGFLGTVLLYWIFIRIGLNVVILLIQICKEKVSNEIPPMFLQYVTRNCYNQSKLYRMHKLLFQMGTNIYIGLIIYYVYMGKGVMWTLWERSGDILNFINIWPSNWDEEIGWTAVFVVVGTMFYNTFDIPIRLIDNFLVEAKFGFNRQTLLFFIIDEIKLNATEIILAVPISVTLVIIVKIGGPHFYIWLWGAATLFLLSFMLIYPNWILPAFNQHVPLQEGGLKRKLKALCDKVGFPIQEIYILKDAQRTGHNLAYFFGISSSKRIVLSENLLRDYLNDHEDELTALKVSTESRAFFKQSLNDHGPSCTEDEIVALVAHELGHWILGHVWVDVILATINLAFFFIVFSMVYYKSTMYEAFKFPAQHKKPIFIGLWIVYNHIIDTINFVMDLIIRKISRVFELRADQFAVSLGHGEELKMGLLKTNIDNLNLTQYHPIYIWYYLDQPPLHKRLRLIEAAIRKMQ